MQPNQTEGSEVVPTSPVKETMITPLCKPSPVAKYLALVLLVLLPFVGAYLGWMYASQMQQADSASDSSQLYTGMTGPITTTFDVESVEHFIFNGARTGYFAIGDNVFYAPIDGNTNDGQWTLAPTATLIVGADRATFGVLASEPATVGSIYAFDRNRVYSGTTILDKADVSSSAVFGRGGAYLVSDTAIYLATSVVLEGDFTKVNVYAEALTDEPNPYLIYLENVTTGDWYKIWLETKDGVIRTQTELMSQPLTEAVGELLYSNQILSFPEKSNTTIRYAVANDLDGMGAKNSKIPFDYYWTYSLLLDTNFTSDEAYEAAQLPYLTMLTTFDDTIVFTTSCFKETECAHSGLYSYDAPSKTLSVLATGKEYNAMYTGTYLSPNGRKLLLIGNDELKYIDLQNDTIHSIANIEEGESALFAICELGCQSGGQWIDNGTVEVEVYVYEICIASETNSEPLCGKQNAAGKVEWSAPTRVEKRQYSI